MKKYLFKYSSIAAIVAAFFLTACSDDSSSGVSVDESSTPYSPENISSSASSSTSSAPSSSSSDTPTANSSETTVAKSNDSITSSISLVQSSSSTVTVSSSAPQSETAASSENLNPTSSETVPAKSWRENCLDTINAYRATEGAAPLTLAADSLQTCTDKQAAADMEAGSAHGHFGNCHEMAQNTGPDIKTKWQGTDATQIAYYYSAMMWEDEKALVTSGERDPNKSEDYSYIGHYLNMRSTKYSKVACGFAISSDGETAWFNMNFYK